MNRQDTYSDCRLIVFAHGSRDAAWRRTFERVVDELQKRVGQEKVRLAYLQFVSPTLREAGEEAVRAGYQRLRILPMFFSGGGHVDADIPDQVAELERSFPGLQVEVLGAIGEHPAVVAAMLDVAEREAIRP